METQAEQRLAIGKWVVAVSPGELPPAPRVAIGAWEGVRSLGLSSSRKDGRLKNGRKMATLCCQLEQAIEDLLPLPAVTLIAGTRDEVPLWKIQMVYFQATKCRVCALIRFSGPGALIFGSKHMSAN